MLLPTSKAEETEALVRKEEAELVRLEEKVTLPSEKVRLLGMERELELKVMVSVEASPRVVLPSRTDEPWTVRRREMVTFSDSRFLGFKTVMPAPVEVEGGMRMVGTLESRELTVKLRSLNLCSREARESIRRPWVTTWRPNAEIESSADFEIHESDVVYGPFWFISADGVKTRQIAISGDERLPYSQL